MAKYNDLSELFKDLQKAAESIEGSYALSDILNDNFVSANTSFSTYEEMVEQSPVKIKDDMEDSEIELLDNYIASNTNYSDWEEMLNAAGTEYAAAQLKLKGF